MTAMRSDTYGRSSLSSIHAALTSVGADDALKVAGIDTMLPGYEHCLQQLHHAIAQGALYEQAQVDALTHEQR